MDDLHVWNEALALGLPDDGVVLAVEVGRQRMGLIRKGSRRREFVVSTSKNGTGNVMDSFMTPTGWHEIVERYGEGEPPGRVFFEREPTPRVLPLGDWATDLSDDLIMTRILRLAGLEDGVNRGGIMDTYERYIYFHGSNHEHRLGQPASHGCIHVGNVEIIELYDDIAGQPAWCWIG
jgi:hypothetical protein